MNKEIIGPLPPVYEMRAPYKMKVRKTAYLSYKDYCEYLKREGRQYEVFGRTILAHLPNLPGIRINVDDFNLIYPEFRSINKLCYSNGEKIWPSSFDTLGSSLKLSLVCIEFQENNIPIPLFETDTIWYEWYYYPKIHERRAQPIPRKVEREGYQPDRYQTCYAGGEIAVVQTVFVIDDVVVCEMELINCTDRKKQLTIACHDQRGIGIEKTLSISPPSFEARKQKDILIIKYGSLPLTNTYTAVYSSLSNKWEIQESDDVSYRLVSYLNDSIEKFIRLYWTKIQNNLSHPGLA